MTRNVRVNIVLSLDGHYHGPGGPGDMGAIVPYAVTEVARDHVRQVWDGATTAVLGRGNAEGFLGFWSPIAQDEAADPRDRGYAQWLVGVEKVVFSTTLTEPPWERTRIVNGAAPEVVAELKETGSGDILVNTSPSIAKPLLAADLVDRLYLIVTPELTGGGARLFEDGIPATKWTLASQDVGEHGEMALIYHRNR